MLFLRNFWLYTLTPNPVDGVSAFTKSYQSILPPWSLSSAFLPSKTWSLVPWSLAYTIPVINSFPLLPNSYVCHITVRILPGKQKLIISLLTWALSIIPVAFIIKAQLLSMPQLLLLPDPTYLSRFISPIPHPYTSSHCTFKWLTLLVTPQIYCLTLRLWALCILCSFLLTKWRWSPSFHCPQVDHSLLC